LNRPAQIGLPRYVIAQQLTGRDVGDVEMRGDQRALSSLARAGRRDHQYPHARLLRSSSPAPAAAVDSPAREQHQVLTRGPVRRAGPTTPDPQVPAEIVVAGAWLHPVVDREPRPVGGRLPQSVRTRTRHPERIMTTEKAILAGGCFWGMQDLIRKLPGVTST